MAKIAEFHENSENDDGRETYLCLEQIEKYFKEVDLGNSNFWLFYNQKFWFLLNFEIFIMDQVNYSENSRWSLNKISKGYKKFLVELFDHSMSGVVQKYKVFFELLDQ